MKFQGKIMPFRLFTLKKHLFGTDNPLCKYRNPLKLLQNLVFSLKMDDVTLSCFGWEKFQYPGLFCLKPTLKGQQNFGLHPINWIFEESWGF